MATYVKLKDGTEGALMRQEGSNVLVQAVGEQHPTWHPVHAVDYIEERGSIELAPGESGIVSLKEGEDNVTDHERPDEHRDGGE